MALQQAGLHMVLVSLNRKHTSEQRPVPPQRYLERLRELLSTSSPDSEAELTNIVLLRVRILAMRAPQLPEFAVVEQMCRGKAHLHVPLHSCPDTLVTMHHLMPGAEKGGEQAGAVFALANGSKSLEPGARTR